MINLSPRLRMIASLVPPCSLAADIGADHGRLSAALLLEGICARILVCDISAASLAKARALLEREGLTNARFCVGDGLAAYAPDAPEVVILAGMGARTVLGILERGKEILDGTAVVISPSVDVEYVRSYLGENGFVIEGEAVVRSAGRWVLGLHARKDPSGRGERLSRGQCLMGPRLLQSPNDDWRAWLRWRIQVLESEERALVVSRDAQRLARVQADLACLHEGLKK